MYFWKDFTFYKCNNNVNPITNPFNIKYVKYEVEIWVPEKVSGHLVSLYYHRVEDKICRFGEITEFHPDLINIKR